MHVMTCKLTLKSDGHSHSTECTNDVDDENYPVGMGETIAETLLAHADVHAVRVLMEAARYLAASGCPHAEPGYTNERFYEEAREGIRRHEKRIEKMRKNRLNGVEA